ncbi:DMT family transporter [Chelativorans sp. AA-79]|uniref:DMT family transporter n=1 Tax=Chelativorans sp. AA-79 TaxID=3028735 RepID=UPI0023F902A9|nr:DMT family transporter [Chelativorans sp. AA-79]WEX07235.1 DMT family transporter [Chelativorans sp. AA-79]
MALSANLRGALFMAVAMAGFTVNDTLVKSVLPSMNMGQAILLRGVFATALLVFLIARAGSVPPLRVLSGKAVLTRVACEMTATVSFIFALSHLPLANVTAVLQALPLAVTMGATFVFAEPVGWRRWSAIAVGFLGVLVIVRPGFEGFSAWSLLALATVAACAVRDLSTRFIPADVPTAWVSAATATGVTLCGLVLIPLTGGWTPLTLPSAAFLFGAAGAIVIGYQFVIMAMRQGEISFMAPFRYTALLWAVLLGYLVFGDVPDGLMLLGSTLVVASGLYALYRERVAGRKRPIAESTAPGMAPDGA